MALATLRSEQIRDSAIVAAKIAANQVTAGKLADGAIDTAARFAAGVVEAAAIASGAVTTAKIADANVTAAKADLTSPWTFAPANLQLSANPSASTDACRKAYVDSADALLAPLARIISAGDGLSGGGDLSADRSFAVDSSVVRTSGEQTIGGIKTFSAEVDAAIFKVRNADVGDVFKVLTGASSSDTQLSCENNRLSNVATPSDASDAASKGYVDSVAQGLDVKASVRLATVAAMSTIEDGETLVVSGLGGQIDGIAYVTGDRGLVRAQTLPRQNGIYTIDTTLTGGMNVGDVRFSRTTDFDAWSEIPGAFVFVEEGTTYADTGWVCTADAGGSIGSETPITWTQFSGAGTYTAGAGLTLTGTVFSLAESAAGAGLTISSGALAVGAGDGIDVAADSIAVDVSDLAGAGLENDGSNNLRIAESVAGAGLTFAAGVLSVGSGNDGVTVSADALAADWGSAAQMASAITVDSNYAGTSSKVARIDHRHNAYVDVPVGFGASAAQGNSTALARANHVHPLGMAKARYTSTDGTTSFTLASAPIANSMQVTFNGQEIEEGASYDYSTSGTTLSLLNGLALASGDVLRVHYHA